MAATKPESIVENCLIKDVQGVLDRLLPDYDLIGQSSHQVGTGFGARVEALLTFRLRRQAETNGKPNGNNRGKMIPAVPSEKNILDNLSVTSKSR